MTEHQNQLQPFSSVVKKDVPAEHFQGQTTRPLNGDEIDWLNSSLQTAQKLMIHYKVSADGSGSLRTLDDLLDSWRADDTAERLNEDSISIAVGCLFGHCMVQGLSGNFVVVSDQYGTDLGVETLKGEIGFPIDSVAKRLDRPDATLSELFAVLHQHHEQIRQSES